LEQIQVKVVLVEDLKNMSAIACEILKMRHKPYLLFLEFTEPYLLNNSRLNKNAILKTGKIHLPYDL